MVLAPSYLRNSSYSMAGRDSWEIGRGLTLTTSIALDVMTPRTEKYDRQSNIDFRMRILRMGIQERSCLRIAMALGAHSGVCKYGPNRRWRSPGLPTMQVRP